MFYYDRALISFCSQLININYFLIVVSDVSTSTLTSSTHWRRAATTGQSDFGISGTRRCRSPSGRITRTGSGLSSTISFTIRFVSHFLFLRLALPKATNCFFLQFRSNLNVLQENNSQK